MPSPISKSEIIQDKAIIKGLIEDACKTRTEMILSTTKDPCISLKDCKLINISEATFSVQSKKEITPDKISILLTDSYCVILAKKASIFFKSPTIQEVSNGFVFEFPLKVAIIQRRNNIRYTFPASQLCRVSFSLPSYDRFTHQVVNLSAQGMAFLIEKQFTHHFPLGNTINNLDFTIPESNHAIHMDAIIRHITQLNDGMAKIGVQFVNITQNDIYMIGNFVTFKQQFEEQKEIFDNMHLKA